METVEEWSVYIDGLSGEDLLSKARAANCIAFVRSLEEDGFGPEDVSAILKAFALRLQADGQEVPARSSGCYIDYGVFLYPANLEVETVS